MEALVTKILVLIKTAMIKILNAQNIINLKAKMIVLTIIWQKN